MPVPDSMTANYDSNGNLENQMLFGFAPYYGYEYDDENRLVTIIRADYDWNVLYWRTTLAYDGLGRLRERKEYSYPGGDPMAEQLDSTTRYIYDGWRVIQERNESNIPTVSYTRGTDLSGTVEGAGGIGGLLARSHGYSSGNWSTHNYYHADGNGNITYLVNSSQTLAARYRYDPYGNLISSSGSLASANVYRFSSKEIHVNSGLYYYGYRWYAANLQRWLNQDPLGKGKGQQLYEFNGNAPVNFVDPQGHMHSTGKPHKDDGRASIVCDGKGGIRIYYPPGKQPKNPNSCEAKCLVEHENSHKWDALNENPDICKGQRDGTGIAFEGPEEQGQGEVRASQVELDCLDDCKNPPCDPKRRKQVEDYQKKYEKQIPK